MPETYRPDYSWPSARSLRAPVSLWNPLHDHPGPVTISNAAGVITAVVPPSAFPKPDERCTLHNVVRCPSCDDWRMTAAIRARGRDARGPRRPAPAP